ncbi:glutamate racemase [Erythrobacter sp. Alg231-14]|uniref:glutamate racemase n=1 Tax=Erythrobacter sp. Alg231-14 TaxID=1922225 RepID=UPI000D553675
MFDSGVGGLSVYDEVHRALPDAPIVYAADFAGLPYGTKSEAEIAARVAGLLGKMSERFEPRLICIACNTASTIALGMVREVMEVPIVGTVPAIKPAALASRSGVIGLLGTQATIRQAYVDDLEREFVVGKTLLRHAAPGLVNEAERKLRGGTVDRGVLAEALRGVSTGENGAMIDHVILGCTHFPLLSDELKDVAVADLGWSSDVQFVDGAAGIARRVVDRLAGQPFQKSGQNRFVVTGPISNAGGLESALSSREFAPAQAF